MKVTLYRLIAVLLLIPLLGFSNGPEGRYKKTKTVKKEFDVNNDALLKINNRYGNVDITSWSENQIVIEVEITVSGNNEDRVIDKLEDIYIDFDSSQNMVYAKTIINKNQSSSWFSWFGNNNSNLNYKINYTVKMPITNDLTIYNDYGSIFLNELDGEANINCDYGKINIGSLNNSNNKINIDYTNHSTIEFMDGGKINADYSKFTLEKSNKVSLNADYSTSVFENVKNIRFNCDYGNLTIDKADTIVGDGDYLSMRFGQVFQELEVEADYGSIKIAELQDGFERVKIDSDYTGVRIGLDDKVNCNIIAKLSYGGFSYDDNNFTFNIKRVKSSSKYYEGYHGNENSNSTISITTDYGSVKLFNY
jgi:hypothetical protein